MKSTFRGPEKAAQLARFTRMYSCGQSAVALAIERRVCGCDYGGTSWSTRQESDRLGQLLNLRRGQRLLEIGAGSGWPGLYLAKTSGCDVTLSDLLPDSLSIAAQRAARDRMEGETGAHYFTVADGVALPFAEASFDAIVHCDVLCCLEQKAATLRACRQVIAGDGRMAFTMILTTPGLRGDDLAQATAAGPTYVATEIDYPDMVRQAGWQIDFIDDITPQYADTLAHMLREEESHADDLRPLITEPDFSDRLCRHRNGLTALARGLLRREMHFVRPAAT